ncbi:hypothetical protein K8I85_16665 [bacterium]|nr:hypothetical protein [bacterium]
MHFEELAPVIAIAFGMMIPLAAIIGGITAGIVKSNARHRLVELAQRERIAALERGIDPERLPRLELPSEMADNGLTFEQKQQRRSELLRIWGFITFFFGVAMLVGIGLAEGFREAAPTMMFAGVGIALIISGYMVKPSPGDLNARADRS